MGIGLRWVFFCFDFDFDLYLLRVLYTHTYTCMQEIAKTKKKNRSYKTRPSSVLVIGKKEQTTMITRKMPTMKFVMGIKKGPREI